MTSWCVRPLTREVRSLRSRRSALARGRAPLQPEHPGPGTAARPGAAFPRREQLWDERGPSHPRHEPLVDVIWTRWPCHPRVAGPCRPRCRRCRRGGRMLGRNNASPSQPFCSPWLWRLLRRQGRAVPGPCSHSRQEKPRNPEEPWQTGAEIWTFLLILFAGVSTAGLL